MEPALLTAGAAVVLAALAVFPGSLGVVMFTHRLLARPAGALLFNVLSLPFWVGSVALLIAAAWLAVRRGVSLTGVLLAAAVVGVITLFGFLMHMRFMFKPVREPRYLTLDEAIERFGPDEEVVGVIDREGRPYAYVARLARRPHIVYQSEGEAPFLMSHCILSHSSMAYELDDDFSGDGIYVSSVLANNLVFYDRPRNCTVLQIQNRARDGSYSLKTLPTVHASLATWQRFYPESPVWYRPREWRDTFYLKLLARASVIDPDSPELVYPLEQPADERLPLKAYVMGVHLGGEAMAYPDAVVRHRPVLQDELGGEPIAFVASADGSLVQLFSRRLEPDRVLDLVAIEPERLRDSQTGSTWAATGLCVAGELEGRRLEAIPHYNRIFWCVWADYFPSTGVYAEAVAEPVAEQSRISSESNI